MTPFQWIFGGLCLLLALNSLRRVYRRQSSLLSGVFWSLLWAVASLMIFRPGITSEFAAALGIGRGADLVIYLAILGGVFVTRYFYNRMRRLENLLTQMVRARAIETASREQH